MESSSRNTIRMCLHRGAQRPGVHWVQGHLGLRGQDRVLVDDGEELGHGHALSGKASGLVQQLICYPSSQLNSNFQPTSAILVSATYIGK